MKELLEYALKFIGTAYIWGGKCPLTGLDCSGLVSTVLHATGILPPGDHNAQSLFNWCRAEKTNPGVIQNYLPGALVFYGQDDQHVVHVALLLNSEQIIEAGGGDHTCVDVKSAAAKNAFTKISTLDHRKDLVAVIMPPYPAWVLNGGL